MKLVGSFAVLIAFLAHASLAHGQAPPIRSSVNEVILPVTVLDSKGTMILDLSEQSFHVFDNGEEQKIDGFDLGGDPLAIALVIETSSRIRPMAQTIRNMAVIFTETVMAADGEAALITYDRDINVKQPFTRDHDTISRAIGNLAFSAPDTRLYDGMTSAVRELQRESNSRRIMLVIGESQDHTSKAQLGTILRDVQQANIAIYSVGLSSTAADIHGGEGTNKIPLPKSLPPAATEAPPRNALGESYFDVLTPAIWLLSRAANKISDHQLEVAAAATGGVHYRTLSSQTMQAALDKIGGELHAQYILSYAPNVSTSGFHQIRVAVDSPQLTVRTRPGYFIEQEPEGSNTTAQ